MNKCTCTLSGVGERETIRTLLKKHVSKHFPPKVSQVGVSN